MRPTPIIDGSSLLGGRPTPDDDICTTNETGAVTMPYTTSPVDAMANTTTATTTPWWRSRRNDRGRRIVHAFLLVCMLVWLPTATHGKTPYNTIIETCKCELPSTTSRDIDVLLLEGIAGLAKAVGPEKRLVLVGDSTIRGLFLAIVRAVSLHPSLAAPFSLEERQCPRCAPRSCHSCIDRDVKGSLNDFVENFEWGHVQARVAGLRIEYQYDAALSHNICFDSRQLRQVLRLHQKDAYAVLFNYGIWFLHLYPQHDCLKFPPPQCASYNETVRESALWLRSATGPQTKLVWKTTNAICEGKFISAWLETSNKWHGTAGEREAMEAKCRLHCPFYNDERPCAGEIYDAASAERQPRPDGRRRSS